MALTSISVNKGGRMRGVRGNRLVLASLGLGVILLLTGCESLRERQIAFDGYLFKARTSAVDRSVSRADFTATILSVSQSLSGARQAGRYEGTKYCIAQYGTSRVKWTIGPDTPPQSLQIVDDTLTFVGRCDP